MEKHMQIILVQNEIEEAISNFIRSKMTISNNCSISIDLRATRGADGSTAIVDVVDKATGSIPSGPIPRTVEVVEQAITATIEEATEAVDKAIDSSKKIFSGLKKIDNEMVS